MNADELYSTAACPVGSLCESCGDGGPGLAACTADTQVGVVCLTLCPGCAGSGMTPRMSVGTVVRFVGAHCEHLGITVDDMAEVLAGEQR